MLVRLPLSRNAKSPDLIKSNLLNEDTFYPALIKDLKRCRSEVIIESAFVSSRLVSELLPILVKLKKSDVRIVINTRDPRSNDKDYFREDSCEAVSKLQHAGVHVVFTKNHHRKLVILDQCILYEGSLNILSQSKSCEVMRRVESAQLAQEMISFIDA